MLLPSAFACEGGSTLTQPRPHRPKLLSTVAYQPTTKSQQESQPHGQPTSSSLFASCRALQVMLGNSLPSPSYLLSRTPTRKKDVRNPFEIAFTQSVKKRTPPRPRGVNKRRRSESNDDKENQCYARSSSDEEKAYSTPKRQRRIPISMPLGLTAMDFQSLQPPSLTHSPAISLPDTVSPTILEEDEQSCLHSDSGYGPSPASASPSDDAMIWSIHDDRVLVETVLEKLQLSKRAWNDCARKLGKDKDSLGRRWRMLVDEGEVGLKKGGRRKRTGLDVGSW